MTQRTCALVAGSVSAATQKRRRPSAGCRAGSARPPTPRRQRRSGRDRADRQRAVEPGSVRLTGRLFQRRAPHRDVDVPVPHGGRSTVTTTSADVHRPQVGDTGDRRERGDVDDAEPQPRDGAARVLVNVRRMSSVPNVEFCAVARGPRVRRSRSRAHVVRRLVAALARVELRHRQREAVEAMGELRFSGPGAPSRWPAPALVPLVSTKMKSLALLLVSCTAARWSGPASSGSERHALQFPPAG